MDLEQLKQLWLPVILILAGVVVTIAIGMEGYKKKIRKDKASQEEISFVAAWVSLILTIASYYGFDFPGHPISIIWYFGLVYALQFFVDMKVIKWIIRFFSKRKNIDLEGFLDD